MDGILTVLQRYGWQGRRVAQTNGGEWAGPCPFCGGKDRFRVWPNPPLDGKGRWWCRQCGRHGDAVDFVRERDGIDYRTARERLGLALPAPDPARPPIRPAVPNVSVDPPPARWRQAAGEFQGETAWWLWQPEGERALDYLHRRGFRDRAILQAGLGYNPQDRRVPREEWGLSPDPDHPIWLPRGIVIPWFVHGEIWRLNIRRPLSPRQIEAGEPKYVGPAGWRNCLYNVDALDGERPAMLVEGELDALAVWQEAGDVCVPVATGSAGGGRSGGWLGRLAYAPLVLVAFDADDAGDKASAYWLERLGKQARRWRPVGGKDPAEMLEKGLGLRAWVLAGLFGAEAALALAPKRVCACGADYEGRPWQAGESFRDGRYFCPECAH